jgi:hypothetical protein
MRRNRAFGIALFLIGLVWLVVVVFIQVKVTDALRPPEARGKLPYGGMALAGAMMAAGAFIGLRR